MGNKMFKNVINNNNNNNNPFNGLCEPVPCRKVKPIWIYWNKR